MSQGACRPSRFGFAATPTAFPCAAFARVRFLRRIQSRPSLTLHLNSNNRSFAAPPPKPWERAAHTGESVHASTPVAPGDAPKPWELPGTGRVPSSPTPTESNPTGVTRPPPARFAGSPGTSALSTGASAYAVAPYTGAGTVGGGVYGTTMGSMYGGGTGQMYGAGGYGGYGGGGYGGGMGSGMYGGGLGSGMYGGGLGSGYGGGMYGNRMGMGLGMASMMPGPGGMMDPNNPNGGGPPPSKWGRAMAALQNAALFAGKIAWLVDENSQALHFFMTALLGLLDRGGALYGELARFVLRMLGFPTPYPPKLPPGAAPGGFLGGAMGGALNSMSRFGAAGGYGGGYGGGSYGNGYGQPAYGAGGGRFESAWGG